MDEERTTAGPGARIAPEAVWREVRADYLAGLSAPDCCRRHGVGLTALRLRAAREGWRRADQPWIPPSTTRDPWDPGRALEDQVHGDLSRIEPHHLMGVAWDRIQMAVLRGDAGEVLRWSKVQALMQAEADALDRFIEEEEARAFARRRANGPHDPHGADDPDDPDALSVPADPRSPPAPPRPDRAA
jgi:hypothetical protein